MIQLNRSELDETYNESLGIQFENDIMNFLTT